MSVLITESFEAYVYPGPSGTFSTNAHPHPDKWNISNAIPLLVSVARTGTYCAGVGSMTRQVTAAEEDDTFIVGFAVLMSSTSPGIPLAVLRSDNAATIHVALYTGSGDPTKLAVYRGDPSSGGTLLGETPANVLLGDSTWRYVELKATLGDGTSGSVEVRVNEVTKLSLPAVDTKNGGTKTTFDAIQVTNSLGRRDDVYVLSGDGAAPNDFLGAVHIDFLGPNGNGNSSDWDGSDGNSVNNYDLLGGLGVANPGLDQFNLNGSDQDSYGYVDGGLGDKDTYAFTDSTLPTGNAVHAVVAYALAKKTDAGAGEIEIVARLSSTEQNETPKGGASNDGALTNGVYHLVWGVYPEKPGGGAWAVSDVNSAEFGQEGV